MSGLADRVTLADVEAAAARISSRVRRTPCLRTRYIRDPLRSGPTLLKLESLQVTGAFKVRGANNAILQLDDAALARGVITASGGNHGLAVAYGAHASGCPAVVYLPKNTPADKAEKIRGWGAEVVVVGAVWDDAERAALVRAEADGLSYIHPFADPAVIAGQGTIAREMLKQSPDIDVIVAGIGGGGLIAGVALAAKAIKPAIKIIGVEPVGAPTLSDSLQAGELVTLDAVDSGANTLAPRRSAEINLAIIEKYVDDIVLVSDEEMRAAAQWLWFEMGQAVELAGAAAVAAIQTGKAAAPDEQIMAAIVCGTGTAGLSPVG
ncbi:MAG: pyridoxal-phosphate dependent enzyme [Alphaproteobacteria bacterium]|nr:pyridoxal-phosphate dependent enzyme [Alphaproteobacteria bacterium]